MYSIVTIPVGLDLFVSPFNWPLWRTVARRGDRGHLPGIGHIWRDRQLPPGPTVRSMVYRGLHPDHSIAAVLRDCAPRT